MVFCTITAASDIKRRQILSTTFETQFVTKSIFKESHCSVACSHHPTLKIKCTKAINYVV